MKIEPESAVQAKRVVEVKNGKGNGNDELVNDFLKGLGSNDSGKRRLSDTQIKFRNQLLEGATPWIVAQKHVILKWTHTFLVSKLVVIAILSTALSVCGYLAWQAAVDDNLNTIAGKPMLACGLLMVFSALFGAYGARRIKTDLETDDDGMETPGQILLEVYFHVTVGFLLVLFPISLAILADSESFLNDGTYGATETYTKAGAALGIVISLVTLESLRSTVMIVTPYEISNSFLESFSTILVALGIAGLMLCFSFLEYGQFLSEGGVQNAMLNYIYFFISVDVLFILFSILGFGAAFIESDLLLKVHAGAMAVLFVCIFIVFIGVLVSDLPTAIDTNCRDIMQMMSESWWSEVVHCEKYAGSVMGAQVEIYNETLGQYTYSQTGVGISARCPSLESTAFAWEYYDTALLSSVNTSIPNYEGCLQLSCCQVLINEFKQITSILVIGLVLLHICIVVAIAADRWLWTCAANQTEKIKAISRTKTRTLLSLIVFLLLGSVIALSVFFKVSNSKMSPQEIIAKLEKDTGITDVEIKKNTTVHFCNNKKWDGNETDIDCGGDPSLGGCSTKCAVNQACSEDSDCQSGHCNTTTYRCRRELFWEQCTNGIRDGDETSIDCGGGECLSFQLSLQTNQISSDGIPDWVLEKEFLCPLNESCSADSDCLTNYCDNNFCSSCYDKRKNSDEGDVDCGSQRCMDYFRLYPETNMSNFPNADSEGLCLDGRTCSSPDQCSSGVCHDGVCVSCSNGVQDGDEADVDCGGRVCQRRCKVGKQCHQMYDCITQRCTSNCATGFCGQGLCETVYDISKIEDPELAKLFRESATFTSIAIECSDSKISVHETDVDCGGSLCPTIGYTCDDGKKCADSEDCSSNLCYNSTCVSCENNIQDGLETGVDCGGSHCEKRCGLRANCKVSTDCKTGLFCWTSEHLAETVAIAERNNVTALLSEVFIPPVNTCQAVISIQVSSASSQLTANTDLKEIYSELHIPYPIEYLEDLDDNATATEGRRLTASERRRRRLAVDAGMIGTYYGQGNFFEPWSIFCDLTTTFEVEEGYEFIIVANNGAKVTLASQRTVIITRTWGSYSPEIKIQPTQCKPNYADGITISRIDKPSCSYFNVMYGPNVAVATMRVARSTTIYGRVFDQDETPIPGAFVRIWALRRGDCVASSDAGNFICDGNCHEMSNTYHSCIAGNNTCCSWEETAGIRVSECLGSSIRNTPVIESTDENGRYIVVIPEMRAIDPNEQYRIEYGAIHDNFITSLGNVALLVPGNLNLLPDIYMVPAPIEACSCFSYETPELEMEDALCKNPINRHCVKKEGTCATLYDYLPCNNTITLSPTNFPTRSPTQKPTNSPTLSPTQPPTYVPTISPTDHPSTSPTEAPTNSPTTAKPTESPTTREPTSAPSEAPTDSPTKNPTMVPTISPSDAPTDAPTESPTTATPTGGPTDSPSAAPTDSPTLPTNSPTVSPTDSPSNTPTKTPTKAPSEAPTLAPTDSPTLSPTDVPTMAPTKVPTDVPTMAPTKAPTDVPTMAPTKVPTDVPTMAPTKVPTDAPTMTPTKAPTDAPTESPTKAPTKAPTDVPTDSPTVNPTKAPTLPTGNPTKSPTDAPTGAPTEPTNFPTDSPTNSPSQSPTTTPTMTPTKSPTNVPTKSPTLAPSQSPTLYPTFTPTAFREPFLSWCFESGSYSWLQDTFEGGENVLKDIFERVTGDRSYASISNFTAAWTETFELSVVEDGQNGCTSQLSTLEESIKFARCGIDSMSSCTSVEVELIDNVYSISISLFVGSLGDAIRLDQRMTSPKYIVDNGKLVKMLRNSKMDCWNTFVDITGPSNVDTKGEYCFDVTLEKTTDPDFGNNTKDIQDELENTNLEDEDNFKDLPSAGNGTVEVCPPNRICSGQGKCCSKENQNTYGCETLGQCYCNTGFDGYDCSLVPTVSPTSAPTYRCVPNDLVGGTSGASSVVWAICSAAGACETQPLLCEYEVPPELYDTSGCPDGEWMEVFKQRDCRVTLNLGRETINALFNLEKRWKYSIDDQPYLYYKFLSSTLPAGYDAFSLMLENWSALNGTHLINQDFAIYPSSKDLANDTNRWQYSNYDDQVGFPRDSRPNVIATTETIEEYRYKWAVGYCNLLGKKQSPLTEFSFSLCIPENEPYVPNDEIDTREALDSFALKVRVVDAQTGFGVEANVKIFRGTTPAWENLTPTRTADCTLNYETLETVQSGSDGESTTLSTCLMTEKSLTSSTNVIGSSSAEFASMAAGTYTIVVSYSKGLADSSVEYSAKFATKYMTTTLKDRDKEVVIEVARELDEGEVLIVFQTISPDLDLVVNFQSTEDGSCTISSKILSDGACACSGAQLLRADSLPQSNGKYTQVIELKNLRSTIYQVYIGRNKPVPASSYKKHRDDGRCGADFPLESGEPAQCPPVEVVWGDGTRSLRPCCSLISGWCGSAVPSCEGRYSIDYRRFLDNNWMTEYREDGYCNRPDMLSANGLLATCPKTSPCCGPNAQCGNTSYHCYSDRSIDYQPFYTLAEGRESGVDMSTIYTFGILPLEESESEVSVYLSGGTSQSFNLADPSKSLNYYDGHIYENGIATASGTYMRTFCIDAILSTPQIHEYPSPRYFQWQGELSALSTSCPAEEGCKFVRIGNLRSAFNRSDGGLTPDLNGVYLRRFKTTTGFKAFAGWYVGTDSACRVNIESPIDGKQVWKLNNIDYDILSEKDCLRLCDESSICEVVYHVLRYDEGPTNGLSTCTFHKNVESCGGLRSMPPEDSLERIVYRKRSSTQKTLVSYTHIDYLFRDPAEQLQLYRDEATLNWYFDTDYTPRNFHFAVASSSSDSELPPTVGWRYVLDFSKSKTIQHTAPVDVMSYIDDCRLGGSYPTINSTAEDKGCVCSSKSVMNCFGMNCEAFPIRLVDTSICLEANKYRGLMSNLCDTDEPAQYYVFNKARRHLEARIAIDRTNPDLGWTKYIVVAYEYSIRTTLVIELGLVELTSSSQEVEDAVKFYFTLEGYICVETGTSTTITSYEDSLKDFRQCISLTAAPGDRPLVLSSDYKDEWSVFVVV